MAGAYHKIASRQRSQDSTVVATQMAQEGRKGFMDQFGRSSFASVPGAANSSRNSNAGILAGVGETGHDSAWKDFFNRPPAAPPSVVAPGQTDINADENFGGGTPTGAPTLPTVPQVPAVPTAVDHTQAAIAHNTSWLNSNGVTVPPTSPRQPPPLFQAGTNVMTFPSADPARFKSAFAPGDPNYVAAVQTYNQNLYAPADTQQTAPMPSAPDSTTSSSGWVSTGPDALAAIRQRFGING